MCDECDALVAEVDEVIHDELRSQLVVPRDGVERRAGAVAAHQHDGNLTGHALQIFVTRTGRHQDDAVHLMIDECVHHRPLAGLRSHLQER